MGAPDKITVTVTTARHYYELSSVNHVYWKEYRYMTENGMIFLCMMMIDVVEYRSTIVLIENEVRSALGHQANSKAIMGLHSQQRSKQCFVKLCVPSFCMIDQHYHRPLSHWGREAYTSWISDRDWFITDSVNGLSSVRSQAIIRTNADLFIIN